MGKREQRRIKEVEAENLHHSIDKLHFLHQPLQSVISICILQISSTSFLSSFLLFPLMFSCFPHRTCSVAPLTCAKGMQCQKICNGKLRFVGNPAVGFMLVIGSQQNRSVPFLSTFWSMGALIQLFCYSTAHFSKNPCKFGVL